MTTVARREELKKERPLRPVAAGGWRRGLANLLRKELGQWWGTKMWWVQTIIWVVILNGISAIVALTETLDSGQLLQEVVQTFLPMSVGAIALGTVITVQGAIVGEKELGTAAWVMSKPASRAAFILAKVLAYSSGFWITAIVIPSTLFFIVTRQVVAAPLAVQPFVAGVAVVALSQLFYLMLTLMLGTIFDSRGPIAGIGIAFVMIGLLLKGMIPRPVLMVTPWPLPDISAFVALGMPLPPNWYVPIVAVICSIVAMTAVALWRFAREEF
jgi:ABC-2 type transport system permease protein